MDILTGLSLSIIAAFIPALCYAWFIYWLDRHEKEPWWLLLLAFLWGMVPAVILALISQILLDIPTTWFFTDGTLAYDLVGGSVWAPITEEIAKGFGVILILRLAHQRHTFDGTLDGFIYGALVGLGFGFTENILYFGGAYYEGGAGGLLTLVFFRAVLFGLSHTLFTGLFGLALGYAYLTRSLWQKIIAVPAGLAAGMALHSLHNVGASLAQVNCLSIFVTLFVNWGGLFLLAVFIGLIWQQEKRWIATQLAGEIPDDVYRMITSWQVWQSARWQTLAHGDLGAWRSLGQIRRASTELAFKKQQASRFGSNEKIEADIAYYRSRLTQLGVSVDSGLT